MQQLGKYQLIRKLATGGMAEVYLAKAAGPMGFEKTLVLKRILPHLAEDPSFVELFLEEARLAAQLNHPHIVQIFDFGESGGEYFLAMEYIDGPNLRVLLKRANASGVKLPPALCARLIVSACEGLAFAHNFRDPTTGKALGLIHRDVSPDNIIVSRQGAVKVVDFGIAKAVGQSHKTQTGIIKGKLGYMSPEQVRGETLDRRVDVYALGVVFYELLSGRKPFEAPTDASLMQAILFEPRVPAVQHRPGLPGSVQRILDRALSKEREQRYPDCLALAAELEGFILSTGKSVMAQQLVQLVAQVVPSADAPASSQEEPSELGKPFTVSVSVTSTKLLVPAAGLLASDLPAHRPRHRRLMLAVMGMGMLVMGGGYLASRPGATRGQEPPSATSRMAPSAVAVPLEKARPPALPAQPAPALLDSPPSAPSTAPLKGQRPKVRSTSSDVSPSPKPADSKPTGTGTLGFRVRPFATVFINGKNYGQTPMDPMELPAGTYTVRFVNDGLKKDVTQTVELNPRENKLVKLNLEE